MKTSSLPYNANDNMYKTIRDTRLTVDAIDLCSFSYHYGGISSIRNPKIISQSILSETANEQSDVPEIYCLVHYETISVQSFVKAISVDTDLAYIEVCYKTSSMREFKISLFCVHAAMLCLQHNFHKIVLKLVNMRSNYTEVTTFSRTDLLNYFNDLCNTYYQWVLHEQNHIKTRDSFLASLAFPHETFRLHQDKLVSEVSSALFNRRHLLIEAATGIGKTLGVVFPAVRALESEQLDKILLLTTRRTGRQVYLDGLKQILTSTPCQSIRVLELSSRAELCNLKNKTCNHSKCEGCTQFYERIPAARYDATKLGWLDHATLQTLANKHNICSYYLAVEMTKWSDIIIADVNHYFDHRGFLYELAITNNWKLSVLIDESHNLIDRVRGMYSITISESSLYSVQEAASQGLKMVTLHWADAWKQLHIHLAANSNWIPNSRSSDSTIFFLSELPEQFILSLTKFVTSSHGHKRDKTNRANADLANALYHSKRFLDLYRSFGCHSFIAAKQTELERSIDGTRFELELTLNNVICADHIKERFDFLESSVLFSATLQPFDQYSQLLGLPEHQTRVVLPSPFKAEQIDLHFANINTRFNDRDASLGDIAQLIGEHWCNKSGNYLVFASSYAYLESLSNSFRRRFPNIPSIVQVPEMNTDTCNKFIKRFQSERGLVGFALLGGGFAEGLSLEGDSLIGVFIVNIGLPAANAENEKMSEIIENHFGDECGYRYTYLYPAIRKVTQAVGRLIRGPKDFGSVHLIDQRFNQKRYLDLLPRWWTF